MKKILYILILSVLCGCEVIDEADQLIPVPMPRSGQRTHVLLEYTGFRCVNCPDATETANNLKALYGEQLVVVALHPATNPFTQGKYDYTCPEADQCYLFMGGTAATPFPTGNINIAKTDKGYFSDRSEWPTLLAQTAQDIVAPYLNATAVIDTTTRQVDIGLDYTMPLEARIAVWLVEDSVMGVQAMPDGSVNMSYAHRHMLRTTAFDSPWGIPVSGTPMQTSFILPDKCRVEHCYTVALLLDLNDYHILQAYETKLLIGSSDAAVRKQR